jgi:hypothetical protein
MECYRKAEKCGVSHPYHELYTQTFLIWNCTCDILVSGAEPVDSTVLKQGKPNFLPLLRIFLSTQKGFNSVRRYNIFCVKFYNCMMFLTLLKSVCVCLCAHAHIYIFMVTLSLRVT